MYRFALVKPGNYQLAVTAPGFQQVTRNLVVAVGQATRADMAMQVGGASQTVEVTAEGRILPRWIRYG